MKDELTTAIEAFQDGRCSPEKMAAILYKSAMGEDRVLDLLNYAGRDMGWTKQLDRVGEVYMAMVSMESAA